MGGCPRSEVDWVQREMGRAWTAVSYSGFIWGVSTLGGCLGTEALGSSVDSGFIQRFHVGGVHARQNVGYRGGSVERGQGGFIQRFHLGCPRSVCVWVQRRISRAWTTVSSGVSTLGR